MLKKFLIMISLITAFSLLGKDINQERENEVSGVMYSDYEPVNDDKYVDINQNQNSSKKKKGTKAASDYNHLDGFNLNANINHVGFLCNGNSVASLENQGYVNCNIYFNNDNCLIYCLDKFENQTKFENYEDYETYASSLDGTNYVVQGLITDKDGNFLISAYHCGEEGNIWEFELGGSWIGLAEEDKKCNDGLNKESIIIKYDSVNDKIKKIYKMENENGHPSHVGGLAYTFKNYGLGVIKEYLIISNGYYINIYDVSNQLFSLLYKQKLSIKSSYMSSSNGYLWVGEFGDSISDKPLHGYQINHHKFTNGLNQTKYMITLGIPITDTTDSIKNSYLIDKVNNTYPSKNFSITVPKPSIQGIYCVSNPYIETRLKFYFSASNNTAYVYQAVLDYKDLNGDGVINGTGGYGSNYGSDREWAWETFFTPYQQIGTSLPDGGEAIVIKNNQLYMLNEGTAGYYCEKWDNVGDDPIDCKRELLKIDNLKNGTSVFNNGSITINGSGIDNFGTKVILVIAQNKMGEFYYSMGELLRTNDYYYIGDTLYSQIALKTYLLKPDFVNPFNYNRPTGGKPKVYIEDIKGLYIMNLPSATNQNDSDDWTFTKLRVTMDDIYSLQSTFNYKYNLLYDLMFDETNTEFGDNTNDRQGMLFVFNSFVDDEDPFNSRDINQGATYLNLKEVYNKMKTCYASYGSDCLYKDIIGSNTDFYTYFEENVVCNLLNSSILNAWRMGRRTPVKGSFICEQ